MTMLKAEWIAKQFPEYSADDIYDVLEGNITRPHSFVDDVNAASDEYDDLLVAGELRSDIIHSNG